MKKSFYLLTILALLHLSLASWSGVSARVVVDGPYAPLYPILYVKAVATGTGNCNSWENACDLQTALGTALPGDEIWVQAGIYKPTSGTDRTSTFSMKSGVALYGGFAGTETSREQRDWETNVTTLSGDIGVAGDNSDNSYHVVTGCGVDGTATLDGFTVTGGNADAASPFDSGGGMYNDYGSPSIVNVTFNGNGAFTGGGMGNDYASPSLTNVIFSGNRAGYGGGMNNYRSSPSLTDVTFSGNFVEHVGGGISNSESNPTLTYVYFSGNFAYSGGGMSNFESNPTLTYVYFSGNSAHEGGDGGGMSNERSSPSLKYVNFSNNSTQDGYGGGMYNKNNSSPTLTDVSFSSSWAYHGGGMYNDLSNPALSNVIFFNNLSFVGAGVYNSNSNPVLTNVTFSGNSGPPGYPGSIGAIVNHVSSPTLTNNIVWGNDPIQDQIINDNSTPVVTYSDIQLQGGSVYTGTGNINADPLFVRNPSAGADGYWGTPDDDYGDLRLQLTSPAIDAGNNAAVPPGVLTDLLGFPRFVDIASVPDTGNGTPPIVDMGAYEAIYLVHLPVLQR